MTAPRAAPAARARASLDRRDRRGVARRRAGRARAAALAAAGGLRADRARRAARVAASADALACVRDRRVCVDLARSGREARAASPPEALGRDVAIAGWVDAFPTTAPGQATFSFAVDAPRPPGVPPRVRLTWYDPPASLAAGDAFELIARLRPPHGLRNPGGFDYERWLLQNGYGATGYVRSAEPAPHASGGMRRRWLNFRATLAERIAASAPDADAAALLTALAIGERHRFSEQHWADFRRTGTSHLVAVSGMHVALLGVVVFLLVRRLSLAIAAAARGVRPGVRGGRERHGHGVLCRAHGVRRARAALPAHDRRGSRVAREPAFRRRAPRARCRAARRARLGPVRAAYGIVLAVVRRGRAHARARGAARPACGQRDSSAARRSSRARAARAPVVDRARAVAADRVVLRRDLGDRPAREPRGDSGLQPVLVPITLVATLACTFDALASSVAPALVVAAGWVASHTVAVLHRLAELDWAAIAVAPPIGALGIAALGVLLAAPANPLPGRRLAWLALLPMFLAPPRTPPPGAANNHGARRRPWARRDRRDARASFVVRRGTELPLGFR